MTANTPPSSRRSPAPGNLGSLYFKLLRCASASRSTASDRAESTARVVSKWHNPTSDPGVHPHRRSHRATSDGFDGTTDAENTSGVGTNVAGELTSTVGTLALDGAAVDVHGIQQDGWSRTHCRLSVFSDMSPREGASVIKQDNVGT
jgi:hypothetical protein